MINSRFVNDQGDITTDIPTSEYAAILQSRRGLLWVDMENPRQIDAVEILSGIFKFHSLSVEDCFHSLQYSRVDSYPEYIFVVAHGLRSDDGGRVEPSEVDFFAGPNFVVTFRMGPVPAMEAVIESAVKDPRRLQRGADWLVHAILDALVDGYLPVIEGLSERLEDLEEEALERPELQILARLLRAKRDVAVIHRTSLPMRELISRLSREQFVQIRPATQMYFRDVYDHLVRIAETSESLREVADGALTIYAMAQNNRTNDIIRGLTVLATLGLPTLLVASVYGMNFRHMPELEWRFGYLYALLLSGGISAGILGFLRHKKWI